MFKKNKRVYIAYADQQGNNEFLIRDGKSYFVLTSQKNVFPISANEAYQTLKLISNEVLPFRGVGSFKQKLNVKINKKGVKK